MKTSLTLFYSSIGLPLVLAGLFAASSLPSSASNADSAVAANAPDDGEPAADATVAPGLRTTSSSEVTIEAPEEEASPKDIPWLGVTTSEAPEALAAQLDLEAGVGLVITYVAADSPAAEGGLRKNDVLVRLDDQSLVHPAQLRKLVRVRKEGDTVKLAFYRGGKHQNLSIVLSKIKVEPDPWQDGERALKGNLQQLHQQLRDLHLDDAVREQMRILRDSLGNIKIDQKEVQENIREGMEQARKAIHEALRDVTNNDSALSPLRKILENLAHSGVIVDDKAHIVVRSSGKNVKSTVKSDDTGTIVLLSNPKLYLTAHDQNGKLLFDGPIESADERAKVPPDLWERVEPLLDKMDANAEKPEAKDEN